MRDTPTERIGPDRMEAFVTHVRQVGTGTAYYPRHAAALGRYAGLKCGNVAMLEQAHRDEAEADAAEARLQAKLSEAAPRHSRRASGARRSRS